MKIIEYKREDNITLMFDDNPNHIIKSTYYRFKIKSSKNPYYKSYYNIACMGNTTGVTGHRKYKKSYTTWHSLIRRCYDIKIRSKDYYHKTTVCNEWLCYENFEKWYDENYYEIGNEKMQLDKDILFKGNKIYSPDTCVFVPQRINILFSIHKKRNSENDLLPIGVAKIYNKYKKTKLYRTRICIDNKEKFIGTYKTADEAFIAYKNAKENEIKRIADIYKSSIPNTLYKAMYDYIVEENDGKEC